MDVITNQDSDHLRAHCKEITLSLSLTYSAQMGLKDPKIRKDLAKSISVFETFAFWL